MKTVGMINTAALSLVLGVSGLAFAQQDQHDQEEKHAQPAKPAQQEEKRAEPERPAQQEEKHAQPAKPAQQPDKHTQPAKPAQQADRDAQPAKPAQEHDQHASKPVQQKPEHAQNAAPQRTPQQHQVQQAAFQQHRAQNWQSDHRDWRQRGGYNGYRIPDDRFRGSFGSDHGFRIDGLPFLVVGGYPRFQYEGYWFSMVDPWPGDWANDWYDTDDVYVAYVDNGYYLFDRRHPSVGIAISISM